MSFDQFYFILLRQAVSAPLSLRFAFGYKVARMVVSMIDVPWSIVNRLTVSEDR